jgi:tetraacyldisaccharide 4'-kinase
MHARGFSLLGKPKVAASCISLENPIMAFCGVGNPEAFFNGIRRQGYELALTRAFPDHHSYKRRELDSLIEDAKRLGVRNLVTTAKDAIKLTSFDFEIPCRVLDIEVVLEDAERLVELIRASLSANSD